MDEMKCQQNLSKFVVNVQNDKGEKIKFILKRDGLSWKLSNIIIPEAFGNQGNLLGSTIIAGLNTKKIADAKRKAAKAQMKMLAIALDAFHFDTGRYPNTEEGLNALWIAPKNIAMWEGPYITKAIPKDPWNNNYVYTFNPGQSKPVIMSYGADGMLGGKEIGRDIKLKWPIY